MDAKLYKKLSERQEKGTSRSLSSFEGFGDFFSNDYLGVARHGHSPMDISGSTGSRLLSGNTPEHEGVEEKFAQFFGSEAALHFNSGYDANLGIFSTIPQKGDTVLYDELIHASARDGIRLSWAKSFSFRHNDLEHLEQRLKKAEGAVYVAVEALYSMDGDIAPLLDMVALCETYGAFLIVDEAHSCGILGASGKGLVDALGVTSRVFLRVITFGKAYGSHGAVVLSSKDIKNYLINFCRPFIYSTALPISVVKHNFSIASNADLNISRNQLRVVLKEYRDRLGGVTSFSDPNSPIQIIELGNIKKTQEAARELQRNKIAVKPIFSPTVPEGRERLRICLHAYNTSAEIHLLASIIEKY